MKPFTFMTVVLGLILGFLLASSRAVIVPHPLQPPGPVLVQAQFLPDGDGRDDSDVGRGRDDSDVGRGRESEREEAEGLPVPIVPGSRVTEAEIKPPKRIKAGKRPAPGRVADPRPATVRSISGRLSATEDRARNDARLQL